MSGKFDDFELQAPGDSDDGSPQERGSCVDRVANSNIGCVATCGFGTFVILFMLSPAIVWSMLWDGMSVYSIELKDCDLSNYNGAFPAPVRDFYAQSGLTSVADNADWYLGEWRIFPYNRGMCPVVAQEPYPGGYEFFGATVPEHGGDGVQYFGVKDNHCLRVTGGGESGTDVPAGVLDVFQKIDAANADASYGPTDMVSGIEGIKTVGAYFKFGTIVTWVGIFFNLSLFPTLSYHFGIPIFMNILAWWVPSILSLQELIFSDFNSSKTFSPMFPGCSLTVNTTLTSATFLLYYQAVSLGLWVLAVSSFAFYTLCVKKWSSNDEDGLQVRARSTLSLLVCVYASLCALLLLALTILTHTHTHTHTQSAARRHRDGPLHLPRLASYGQ